MKAHPGDIFFTFENIITGCAFVGACAIYRARVISTMHGSNAAGVCANEGVSQPGSYNAPLLANECKQTRPDDRGCHNEGVCKRYLGLLRSVNRPRSDCRGCYRLCANKRVC